MSQFLIDSMEDARKRTLTRLEQACEEAADGALACESVSLYNGGQYFLYKYRRYNDVRLVFAPEDGIAAFGGDLDNFKEFNDHYGFMRGDSVIKYTAQVLLEAAEASGDPEVFVGHVGGDDFVAVIDPIFVEEFCKSVVTNFDQGILDFYDTADALQGYIEVMDRRGERHAFPISSLSLGVATNVRRRINSEWEASAIASEMKEYAKRQAGSVYEIDRRT